MYSKLDIKDYVTLFLEEADVNALDGKYVWNIPSGYYTNQRSQVCTVSIVAGSITPVSIAAGLLVDYGNGGLNTYNKNQRYIIGHGQLTSDDNNAFYIYGGIDLLTTARPDKISLNFLRETDQLEGIILAGGITLEFCYYNEAETTANYHNQFTPTLK